MAADETSPASHAARHAPGRLDDPEVGTRFAYHPADTDDRVRAHEEIRARFMTLALLMNRLLPPSREASLSLTALQEAAMWANAAVAIHLPHAEGVEDG